MKPQLTRRRFIHTAAAGSVALAAIGTLQELPLLADGTATQKDAFTLATMPRVDVHTHIGNTWTDMASKWFSPVLDKQFPSIRDKVPQSQRYFEFLETDKELRSGIEDERKMQGLALPLEVLEKIYFRNAMRVYPHVTETLTQLGYFGNDGTKRSLH